MFTDLTLKKIEEIKNKDINQLKIILANNCTKMLHGDKQAKMAEETAKRTFQDKSTGSSLPVIKLNQDQINNKIDIINLILISKLDSSKSEIRRIIKNKGVKINNSTIHDEKVSLSNELFVEDKSFRLSLCKNRHIKVKLN